MARPKTGSTAPSPIGGGHGGPAVSCVEGWEISCQKGEDLHTHTQSYTNYIAVIFSEDKGTWRPIVELVEFDTPGLESIITTPCVYRAP